MRMNAQSYSAIAETLARLRPERLSSDTCYTAELALWEKTVHALARRFYIDNPRRFKRDLFLDQCGAE